MAASSAISRYFEKVGRPSAIAQGMLVAWTLACGLLLAVMLTRACTYHDPRDDDYVDERGVPMKMPGHSKAAEERSAAVASSLVCPGVSWVGLALPLGLVALVTIKKGGKPEA